MKTNALTAYHMEATVHHWEAEQSEQDSRYYRIYDAGRNVPCTVSLSPIGTLMLAAGEQFQSFAIVSEMRDANGTPFMDEVWYSVQRVQPIFDAMGALSSYRHTLAPLAAELIDEPINPPRSYPQFDQIL